MAIRIHGRKDKETEMGRRERERGRQEGSIAKDIFCSLSFKIKTKLGLLTRPIDFKPIPLASDRPRATNGCYEYNISHKEHKCKVIQRK
jgi:hypothetical protein